MRLVLITPVSPEWSALAEAGAGDFLGQAKGSAMFAYLNPEPVALFAYTSLEGSDNAGEVQMWAVPKVRGRWWSRTFYDMFLALCFSRFDVLVAGVEEGSTSQRMVKSLGWKMYCQADGVSYYSLTRKAGLGETLHA